MNLDPYLLHHRMVHKCARVLFGYFTLTFQGQPGGDERTERVQAYKGLEVETNLYGTKLTLNITIDANRFRNVGSALPS